MSDVADRVKKIVVEHLGVDESKVTENAASSTIWAPTASTPSSW
jgi:acyl carrier protein